MERCRRGAAPGEQNEEWRGDGVQHISLADGGSGESKRSEVKKGEGTDFLNATHRRAGVDRETLK